ncbi:MAG: hypothetical protein ACREN8_11845, partial [Candidatus Dormibacteraceae bacterium]
LLNRLVDNGSTVIVIEHNLDVISQADWVIDLGPGPGRYGGQVIFQGTPGELIRATDSITASHLALQCAGLAQFIRGSELPGAERVP